MPDLKRINHFYSQNLKKILDSNFPWSKYLLLKLTHQKLNSAKQLLLSHDNIRQLITQLEDKKAGINSLNFNPADFRHYNSFYWTLRFFADLGLSAHDLGITHLIQRLQLQQSEEGQFVLRYYKKRQQVITLICMTAHLTYCLIRLGFRDSPTVKAALKYIITSQRKDGGWHCEKLRQNGEHNENFPSCPAANINVIRALGQFGKKYESTIAAALDKNITLLHTTEPESCFYNSEQHLNLSKLRYPPHFTGMDILNVIDSYSYLPNISQNEYLNKLVNDILNRWDGIHFLCAEKRIVSWSSFDFGHNNKGSDWITAIFVSALNRIYF